VRDRHRLKGKRLPDPPRRGIQPEDPSAGASFLRLSRDRAPHPAPPSGVIPEHWPSPSSSNLGQVIEPTFASPEDAAVADFPPQYVQVESVSYSADGVKATVKLLTNEEPYLYPYLVYCERDENGRWSESHSAN
jgi:hypothetical protein